MNRKKKGEWHGEQQWPSQWPLHSDIETVETIRAADAPEGWAADVFGK